MAMECDAQDLDLLLSLQNDAVAETPPASPIPQKLPEQGDFGGYFSEEEGPRFKHAPSMAVFQDFVKDLAPKVARQKDAEALKLRTPSINANLERCSGLYIKQWCVAPSLLHEKISDQRFIRLEALKNALIGDAMKGNWVTIGVLAEKGHPMLSSNGKNYSIWKLTSFNNVIVSVLLFGSAYTAHWKEVVGTTIAVFNANIRQDLKRKDFSLSIFSSEQLMPFGVSADFSVCKGTKKDGNPCSIVVNRRLGEYCKYHSTASRQKFKTRRAELSGGNLTRAFPGRANVKSRQDSQSLEENEAERKPMKRVRHLSSMELTKALSNADKVTTNSASQGIRFLTSMTDQSADAKKPKSNKTTSIRPALTEVINRGNSTECKGISKMPKDNFPKDLELDLDGPDDISEQMLSFVSILKTKR